MRMGIGIGWPNASANAQVIPVNAWFRINIDCKGTTYPSNTWTQKLMNTTLQTGQYVYYPLQETRVLLGERSLLAPPTEYEITVDGSEGFNSCGI